MGRGDGSSVVMGVGVVWAVEWVVTGVMMVVTGDRRVLREGGVGWVWKMGVAVAWGVVMELSPVDLEGAK